MHKQRGQQLLTWEMNILVEIRHCFVADFGMTKLRFFLLAPLAFLFTACNSEPEIDVDPPDVFINPPTLQIQYNAWNESIQIDGATGSFKHTKTDHEYESPTSGNPKSSTVSTIAERTLDEAKQTALAQFVNDSGFLTLDEFYGAPENQRFYPYALKVMLPDGFEKNVLFRSNPEFEEQPAEFKTVVDELRRISDAIADGN
ncbi:MAG: hypothetical protein ACI8UO_006185 [Verrucomicrobiales bacterium]|jgi:hypothetical protein